MTGTLDPAFQPASLFWSTDQYFLMVKENNKQKLLPGSWGGGKSPYGTDINLIKPATGRKSHTSSQGRKKLRSELNLAIGQVKTKLKLSQMTTSEI